MLIAVDTNVLLDQAVHDADVIDALSVIRERLPAAQFLISPTVLGELGEQEENGSKDERKAAGVVIDSLRAWGYSPVNLIPAGHGIVEQIGFQLRVHGIIPDEEENDALIAAEAALLGCSILLSSDHHLLEANEHPRSTQF